MLNRWHEMRYAEVQRPRKQLFARSALKYTRIVFDPGPKVAHSIEYGAAKNHHRLGPN